MRLCNLFFVSSVLIIFDLAYQAVGGRAEQKVIGFLFGFVLVANANKSRALNQYSSSWMEGSSIFQQGHLGSFSTCSLQLT